MQVKKQQLELYMEQWTGSKSGKEYVKAVFCFPFYLASMQSLSCEMRTGGSTSWNQDCGKISITSDMQMTTIVAEIKEELKSP